jgi:hypothetical protein
VIAPFAEAAPRERGTFSCRACGSDRLRTFARSNSIPVNNARVFATPEEALRVPLGELEIALCESCGFVQNVRFDPALVCYDSTYEEQQSYSPTFASWADGLARGLVERWDLHGKRIIEIGCGKGDFLAALCRLGANEGVGYDPTAAPVRLGDGAARVRMISEFYGPSTGALEADALVCRHTLEHVQDVALLLRSLRASLAGREGTRIFFEVPDVGRVLREGAFWDVYYEHCSYFAPGSLARLFRREGFIVDDVRLGFDDQYILLEARIAPEGTAPAAETFPAEERVEDLIAGAEAYETAVSETIANWRRRVGAARTRGRVAVWGSGSKCVAFLSETGLARSVDAIVDINPHRHNRYLPASALRIDPPETLATLRPDLVVVMNAIYLDEIEDALARMGVDAVVEAV